MRSKITWGIIHIFLILFGFIWIYPFIWMISSSLKTNASFLTSGINPIPETLNWENYTRAWDVANFSGYFLNSVVITLGTVTIVVLLSCLTGYALGRVDFPGRKTMIVIIGALMFIPTGYTIIPLYELMKFLGLSNTLFGVVLAESSGAHVLFILLFAAFFSRVPKEIEEAAAIDGSGFLKTFFKIILPSAKPVIATAVIMQFIWTWSSFLIPLVLTLNNPDLRTLAVGMLSFVGKYQTDWTGMAAGASISLLPVILIFIVMQRYFIEGISGSVK
ncbi:MAG: carbohydrate ABC transporter permease [Bacillota bacterium]|uniref:Carbohydrate ABC transporter permease n=1 Tax=Virgibacillus salarius TaxID=447199 RepID=A0A941DUQ7_9BACI|nr:MULTISPECIES: carbohydrate ABC transporter permease [Bacillaceae]NAZ08459.1 ABC transporter permease subunit [Agaribacter marinus]MBR7795746.1 carbohydrate ABC transporter permease [Virgibacillus salarius]MCC2248632.1 carbohydrate ABC transporter permease [Virgibacillus sp. AGTR]MDY7043164.1 carbohydrate ABC transporter permease [Virgibacillus sp. M23]QRZ18387.1 carbohydrate ABC transporter permease [Virgibacillus sp. AGTR]